MSNESNAGAGIGLPGLLFGIFLTLKLTHLIDWSWWWVTSPLWISAGLWVVGVAILFLGYVFTDKS